jgi:hypothetical protein
MPHKIANLDDQFNKHFLSTDLFWSKHYARCWSTKMNKTVKWGRTHTEHLNITQPSDEVERHMHRVLL